MMVMRQPPTRAAQVAEAKRRHVERAVAAAAAQNPVEGALRVWVMALSVEGGVGRWRGPEARLTCATMDEAAALAAEVEAQPGQWWAVIVDGRTP